MSDKCFNPRDSVAFTNIEIRNIEDYILAGNLIKCNRCGQKSSWVFENGDTIKAAAVKCSNCNRNMRRGVLTIIQSFVEDQNEEAVNKGISEDALNQKWYAVAKGRKTGVFQSWEEVEPLVKGFKGALHKSFSDNAEAWKYLDKTVKILNAIDVANKDNIELLGIPDPNKESLGKTMAGVLADFAPALKEVAELGSMNNKPNGKYDRGSWMEVKNPEVEYNDAFWRHLLDGPHNIDPTTGKHHDVAVAWNALALVYFRLKREGKI